MYVVLLAGFGSFAVSLGLLTVAYATGSSPILMDGSIVAGFLGVFLVAVGALGLVVEAVARQLARLVTRARPVLARR